MARYVIDAPTLLHLVSRAVWRIAREHDWETLRDAAYLTVTRLQADALVTVDGRLAAAAQPLVRVAPVRALPVGERQDDS